VDDDGLASVLGADDFGPSMAADPFPAGPSEAATDRLGDCAGRGVAFPGVAPGPEGAGSMALEVAGMSEIHTDVDAMACPATGSRAEPVGAWRSSDLPADRDASVALVRG
jgi:hypothetical protein